jgi:hypothetical protein
MNMPTITAHPINEAGDSRTGSLSENITPKQITAALGFPPNVNDDPDKVRHSWGIELRHEDGRTARAGIWDYKGSRWSVYDPSGLLAAYLAAYHID